MEKSRGGAHCYNLRPRLHASSIAGTSPKNGNERKPKRRRCQKSNVDDSEWRPWAELLPELLSLISKRLSVADYLSFGRVCRNWRSFYIASKKEYLIAKAPFIIIKPSNARRSCSLLELSTGCRYKTMLPNFTAKFCIGLSGGCLTFHGCKSGFMLANPITGNKLEFPSLFQNQEGICLTDRAFLAYTMPYPGFILVALSSLRYNVQFRRSKDTEWTVFSYAHLPWTIVDVVAFGGSVFCLTSKWQIGVLSLTSTPTLHMVVEGRPALGAYVEFVASENQLLLVSFIPSFRLLIYRIDFLSRKLIRVHNLGKYALFMGDRKCSRISDTSKWGGRSNCLYHLRSNASACVVYSLNGGFIEEIPIGQARRQGISAHNSYLWYFPHESYKLDYVRDDQYK